MKGKKRSCRGGKIGGRRNKMQSVGGEAVVKIEYVCQAKERKTGSREKETKKKKQ